MKRCIFSRKKYFDIIQQFKTKNNAICCIKQYQTTADRNAIYIDTCVLYQRMKTRRWEVFIVMTFSVSCLQLKWISNNYEYCHNPNSTSTKLGLTRKWLCTPPPPPPHPTYHQTQLPSKGASDQTLMLPKQQHQHLG